VPTTQQFIIPAKEQSKRWKEHQRHSTCQQITQEWWKTRTRFDLYVSQIVEGCARLRQEARTRPWLNRREALVMAAGPLLPQAIAELAALKAGAVALASRAKLGQE
jgi:hypothetical protein